MLALGDPSDAESQLLHRCWVAYLSDDLPTDAVLRTLPFGADPTARESAFCASLDHTIWFHGRLSADRWHLYDFTCVHYVGGRGLAIGHVFAETGRTSPPSPRKCWPATVGDRPDRPPHRPATGATGGTVGSWPRNLLSPHFSPTLERLRAHVLEHSVKHGEFTLKSGATSSWFLDTKQTACRPDGIVAVTDALIEVFGDDFAAIDAIGGLTMGADPVAFGVAAVAATRGHHLRSFSVRKEAKQGGITGRIAGALQPGDRVLVTEDTTTRGTSLIEGAEQIAAYGAVRCG